MAQSDIERYDMLEEPDEYGFALYQRRRDGKTALAKMAWFKPAPGNDGAIPRSRVKSIRLDGLGWE